METSSPENGYIRTEQQQQLLEQAEQLMYLLFKAEPEEGAKTKSKKYWDIFRRLIEAEPRYLNYIEQFVSILEAQKEKKEHNEQDFIQAFNASLSSTRHALEQELEGTVGLDKLTLEEREALLTHFLNSEAVKKTLRRTHQRVVVRRDIKEYAKILLERLEASKDGLKDSLTGMLNRRALFEVEGPREIGRAVRHVIDKTRALVQEGTLTAPRTEEFYTQLEKKGCSFIMLDIDHFKQLNDMYGHPIGDALLQQVAKAINLRGLDIVTRYGGEEFFIILPDTDAKDALHVAEQMRYKIEQMVFECGKPVKKLKLSVSMGVVGITQLPEWKKILSYATRTKHDDEEGKTQLREYENELLKDAIKASDQALYIAKRTGRNKVEPWNQNTEILFDGLKQSSPDNK